MVHGVSWWLMVVLCGSFWFLAFFCGHWRFSVVLGVLGGSWWFLLFLECS